MIGYAECFDNNKTMSFKIIDNKLWKRYIKIWERIYDLIGKECDSEPVYGENDKCMKTKIKLYQDKVNTNFPGKEIPKENALYKCL